MKIVHCADLHFDTPFKTAFDSRKAEIRREEIRETFSKIIEISKAADILLISGDLFHSETVSRSTVEFVIRKFAEIPDTFIFIAAGNHDPRNYSSFYNSIYWGDNVHIFSNKLEKVDMPSQNACIYGVSFSSNSQNESLLDIAEVDREKINILVMHGDVVNNGQTSSYNPINLGVLGDTGMDYAALGHVHKFSGINREKSVLWAYPGIPEGTGFDECGEKGVIIGTVEKGTVNLEYTSICKRQYIILETDISEACDSEQIAEKILESAKTYNPQLNLFKIVLTGEVSPDLQIINEVIFEKIKDDFYYVKIEDKTDIAVDYEKISSEITLRGLFVCEMLDKIENAEDFEKETLKLALKLGFKAITAEKLIV